MDIDSLVVTLGLNPQGFKQGLTQVETQLKGFQSQAVSFVKGLAAPLTAAMSAGSIVSSYTKDVSSVASMMGVYTSQMEEWQKKRELLNRITREDVELYRSGKKALLEFDFAMKSLSTTIMRSFAPEIKDGIKLLNKFSDWIGRNENNIVRFLKVTAGVISAALVPAFIKMNAALLASPATWIAAALLALILLIDDLVVYCKNGESALGELWSKFGSGEEIMAAVQDDLNDLKEVGKKVWAVLSRGIQELYGIFQPAFEGILTALHGVKETFMGLLTLDFSRMSDGMIETFQGALDILEGLFEGGKQYCVRLWNEILALIKEKIDFSSISEGLIEAFHNAVDAIKGFFEGLGQYLTGLWDNIMAFFQKKIEELKAMIPSWEDLKNGALSLIGLGDDEAAQPVPSADSMTAAAAGASVTNSGNKTTTVDSHNTIMINAPSNDPKDIAHEINKNMGNATAFLGIDEVDGGVYE